MIEQEMLTDGVRSCTTLRPSEALVTEANLRRTGHRLLFAMYAMQPNRPVDAYVTHLENWLELNREAAPKWLGRLSVDAACIDATEPGTFGEPDVVIGVGLWLAPEPQETVDNR